MNMLVRTLLVGALIVGGGLFGLHVHNETVDRLELDLGKERLRASWHERAGHVRGIEDPERYRDEFRAAARWYASEITALYNRFPGKRDRDQALTDMEAQVAAGKMKPQELQRRKEWFDETRAVLEIIEGGRYRPVVSGIANGVRVDLLGITRVRHEGESQLRLDFVAWGVPRRVEAKKNSDKTTVVRTDVDFGLDSIDFEFIDDQQKLIGGLNGGRPQFFIDHPERWMADFPPHAWIGTYWIDPMPENTHTVSLRIGGQVRSTVGAALPIAFDWELPAKSDWRVREGESFDGDERLLPGEDIDRSARR